MDFGDPVERDGLVGEARPFVHDRVVKIPALKVVVAVPTNEIHLILVVDDGAIGVLHPFLAGVVDQDEEYVEVSVWVVVRLDMSVSEYPTTLIV